MPLVNLNEVRGGTRGTVPVTDIPRSISEIQFGTFSAKEMRKLSHVHVFNAEGQVGGTSLPYGVLDSRLGVCTRSAVCATCGLKNDGCTGHFGHMELALPLFHNGYFKIVLQILRTICKGCCKVVIEGDDRRKLLARMRNRNVSSAKRTRIQQDLAAICQKVSECPHCGYVNGKVKKEMGFRNPRIFHERYGDPKKPKPIHTQERLTMEIELEDALENNPDLKPFVSKITDSLSPSDCISLFQRIPQEDRELLDLDRHTCPSNLLLSTMIVPPICIRPFVDGSATGGAAGTFKDNDLTENLLSTLRCSKDLRLKMDTTNPSVVWEAWDTLQGVYTTLLDADMPGYQKQAAAQFVTGRTGLVQRLKGKEGRFRKHLSGKRVDFSGRTVISPDPNLKITELAVPIKIAEILTYPERVFANNRQRLYSAVVNGKTYPGACYVVKKSGQKMGLAFMGDQFRKRVAENLENGDIVHRHMINGDCVIFNRQPSLHRISMMCHRARVLPYRTLRFNECCCAPYNADFDGDEMNLHLPQTEEARAECATLMATSRNVISARHGEPIIAATQDFLTGGYLLTRKNLFLDRAQIANVLSSMFEPGIIYDLPTPAILKPRELWSGKQVISLLVRPNLRTPVNLNFEARAKFYTSDKHMCAKDGYVCFFNSELISGTLEKKLLGGGGKDGLFYQLFLCAGHAYSAKCMWRLSRLTSRWLMNHGFSIGINDVTPSKILVEQKDIIIQKGYEDCAKHIKKFNDGTLEADPGCTAEVTLENKLNGLLSKVREDCGTLCMKILHWSNSPFIMSSCGSKGSPLNISQMAAVLGQQTVSGKRIGNGFIHRSLPHFKRFSREPKTRGFVANSFYTGLQPHEFWFHTMGGREGLVDTAVKTAETGYMQRRLVKSMEDLCVQYDYKVTDSQGMMIQRVYGDDGLDPLYTETADFRPVNFSILWNSMSSVARRTDTSKLRTLKSDEVLPALADLLIDEKYNEFSGKFKEELTNFWRDKAEELKTITLQITTAVKAGLESSAEMMDIDNETDPLALMKRFAEKKKIAASSEARIKELVNMLLLVTKENMQLMLDECLLKHQKYKCEPGTACGAIGAQSIGEPGTQMTLKTFHFAGVASMSITQGVPRIKEIINAAKTIKTPLITAFLTNETDEQAARVVKARVERTTLGEICTSFDEVYTPINCYIVVRIDLDTLFDLQLDIDSFSIRDAILKYAASTTRKRHNAFPLKPQDIPKEQVSANTLHIYPYDTRKDKLLHNIQRILTHLPGIVVAGLPGIKRAVLSSFKTEKYTVSEMLATGETKEIEKVRKHYKLLIEGADLLEVCSIPGVDSQRSFCNHIAVTEKVLGIEAARLMIIREIRGVMGSYGLAIDIRHVMQLADVMTFRGEVLGITRFGMQKMRDSVMMLASFEKTTDILFDAAAHSRKDDKLGVSEKIIMGAPIKLGTGLFKLLHSVDTIKERKAPRPLFRTPTLFG
eukprot:TRINITY_DN14720_c0_g1_i1.p1 TRINITY_DN14720_c0_g1~~TRINITY_DN14720_c0_g1_i1.p1  ORF type:complete len:1471 (+),score=275.26 TRINITY_DN14720_c0_g1_i1:63-4475(+)